MDRFRSIKCSELLPGDLVTVLALADDSICYYFIVESHVEERDSWLGRQRQRLRYLSTVRGVPEYVDIVEDVNQDFTRRGILHRW